MTDQMTIQMAAQVAGVDPQSLLSLMQTMGDHDDWTLATEVPQTEVVAYVRWLRLIQTTENTAN